MLDAAPRRGGEGVAEFPVEAAVADGRAALPAHDDVGGIGRVAVRRVAPALRPAVHPDGDGRHLRRRDIIPAPQMPTITIRVHGWPKGWGNAPYRHAANTAYVVMRGQGSSTIGDRSFDWEFGDTLAAPAWCRIEHRAQEDSIVFAMSDERLMRWSRYYRFEAL